MSQPLEALKVSPARLWVLYAVLVLMILTLGGALAYRQLIRTEEYAEREKLQNLRRILVPGPRGRILDRTGQVLVDNRPAYQVVIYLAELRAEFRREYSARVRTLRREGASEIPGTLDEQVRAELVQRQLDVVNGLLGRQERVRSRELERHFSQQLLLPFPLLTGLADGELAVLLEQLPVGGALQLTATAQRFYPFGAAAAHTLGYVATADVVAQDGEFGDNLMTFAARGTRGAAGLELQFDEQLTGAPGGEIWMVDPTGRQYRLVQSKTPRRGRDLVTSLDIRLQLAAEAAMGDRKGAVAVVAVRTGEVLALASKPGFDLNELVPRLPPGVRDRIEASGAWLHRGLQGLYPPGSTFKLVAATAGLRTGEITADSRSLCEGSLPVGARNFPCHSRSGHGEVELLEALRASCNVFFYQYGLAVGADRLAEEARRFGLAEPTGIELPFEARRMLVPDREWKRRVQHTPWFPGDTANFAIGQGFLRVTPLQMALLTASLARGETRTRPTILHGGPRAPAPATPLGLSPPDLARIFEGMERAVQLGTGRFARIDGLRIAGKTGTAQVQAEGGDLELAWFIGFAPVENPEIAVAVMMEGGEVDEDFAGGLKAAPIARAVFARAFEDRIPKEVAQQ